MPNITKPCTLVLIFVLACCISLAQMTVTGAITGTVTDPSARPIAGAKVTIISATTGDSRSAVTGDTGGFNMVAVQPGTYSLRVERDGFKTAQRTGLVLSANAHLSTGEIQLQIGTVSETVSVEANAAAVQTESAEHSAVLSTTQLENLTARGRDVVSLLRTIPGVQYQGDQDSVGGSYGTGTPNIGGASNNTNILAVDGVVSNDMGTPNVFSSVTTLDAIGEVKVILNSYQAEYAGNGGAVVEVVTKSGGRDFHGSGYWYHPQRGPERERFLQQPHRGEAPTLSLQHAGRLHRRADLHPRKVQSQPQPVFRLLQHRKLADPPSRQPDPLHDADRGAARRRFFADGGYQRQADHDQRPTDQDALPGQQDPEEPAQFQRPGAAQYAAHAQFHQPVDHREHLQLPDTGSIERSQAQPVVQDRFRADAE